MKPTLGGILWIQMALIFSVFRFSILFFPGNGYIEGTELDGFLREFVSSANATDISPEVSGEKQLPCYFGVFVVGCFYFICLNLITFF